MRMEFGDWDRWVALWMQDGPEPTAAETKMEMKMKMKSGRRM